MGLLNFPQLDSKHLTGRVCFTKVYKEYFCFRVMRIDNRRGQIWVETVIYTLIGLAIIGLVLAGALPKINAKKDEMIIGRSIEAISNIDSKIYEVQRGAGNRRTVNLDIKNGAFVINPYDNTISWILESSFAYSEPGVTVPFGNMNITTTKDGNYEVELKIGYNVDLQYDGDIFGEKRFDVAPIPYVLSIENMGKKDGNIVINFLEV